jgi:hypothetical protein
MPFAARRHFGRAAILKDHSSRLRQREAVGICALLSEVVFTGLPIFPLTGAAFAS